MPAHLRNLITNSVFRRILQWDCTLQEVTRTLKNSGFKILGGFPENIGADDSYTATKIALMGYRAIVVDNAWCVESVSKSGYHAWRIRRAQHLIQHFMTLLKHLPRTPRELNKTLIEESFLTSPTYIY